MVDAPEVVFAPGCPDCGSRTVEPLELPPEVGDDFDWSLRDYDGFRLFMMEELAARAPERPQWTPADMEVVIVEVLAAMLDQLSDMADRVSAEATLETARRPESVRRLLQLVGYDALRAAKTAGQIDESATATDLEAAWAASSWMMDAARAAGPRAIRAQERMVTPADHGEQLEEHPLVRRAGAVVTWGGAWPIVRVAILSRAPSTLPSLAPAKVFIERKLDEEGSFEDDLKKQIEAFNLSKSLPSPVFEIPKDDGTIEYMTIRSLLEPFIEDRRMVGEEVRLVDVDLVGIALSVSVRVRENYFQSEVRSAMKHALDGFFERGRLGLGEAVNVGDVFQLLMGLEGVETVCLNRFKRVGSRWPDQSAAGRIFIDGTALAVCDNDPQHPERGYYNLTFQGGRRG